MENYSPLGRFSVQAEMSAGTAQIHRPVVPSLPGCRHLWVLSKDSSPAVPPPGRPRNCSGPAPQEGSQSRAIPELLAEKKTGANLWGPQRPVTLLSGHLTKRVKPRTWFSLQLCLQSASVRSPAGSSTASPGVKKEQHQPLGGCCREVGTGTGLHQRRALGKRCQNPGSISGYQSLESFYTQMSRQRVGSGLKHVECKAELYPRLGQPMQEIQSNLEAWKMGYFSYVAKKSILYCLLQ